MAARWLKRYFEQYGDYQPNNDRNAISVHFKSDIYEIYKKAFKHVPQYMVPKQRLLELWGTIFPHCVKRDGCNVVGKCDICYRCEAGRHGSTDSNDQKAFAEIHHMHRGGMFHLERGAYMDRILKAVLQDPDNVTIQSLVVDGMDQSHCRIPYLGSQSSFSKPLTQHFTGIKEHTPSGSNITIYRT